MRKIVERCPACGEDLIVTRLSCSRCETEISGRFKTTAFDSLSGKASPLWRLCPAPGGNIKEMERELGVPYTAVRNRLDEVIAELGSVRTPGPGSRLHRQRRRRLQPSCGPRSPCARKRPCCATPGDPRKLDRGGDRRDRCRGTALEAEASRISVPLRLTRDVSFFRQEDKTMEERMKSSRCSKRGRSP